jgi:hypothetical protein
MHKAIFIDRLCRPRRKNFADDAMVHPQLAVKNVEDLIALAKAPTRGQAHRRCGT